MTIKLILHTVRAGSAQTSVQSSTYNFMQHGPVAKIQLDKHNLLRIRTVSALELNADNLFTKMLNQRVVDIYDRKYCVDGVSEK